MGDKLRSITVGIMLSIIVVGVMPSHAASTTNLQIATTGAKVFGDITAVVVSEIDQNNTDLNGDGDSTDVNILHFYNSTSGTMTNLALDLSTGDFQDDYWAIVVDESIQGNTDLNGDGDTLDKVLHLYDVMAGTMLNLGLESSSARINGNYIVFQVNESSQNNTDLNGDGDTFDNVLHVYDIIGGITTNVGLGSSGGFYYGFDGNNIAFTVNENSQGATDLNGDGDTSDNVLHVYDIAGGIATNIGLQAYSSEINGNYMAFEVYETEQGADLNGDGDFNDAVLHVYDITSGITTNVGISSNGGVLDGTNYAFTVWEGGELADLNGDGDVNDSVLHLYEISVDVTTNLALASTPFDIFINNDHIAFQVEEADEGADFNGDGDANDRVLHVYDIVGSTFTNSLISVHSAYGKTFEGNYFSFGVSESEQGNTDLNGDGDTSDVVLHVYDIAAKLGSNSQLALSSGGSPAISADNVLFLVSEFDQGNTSLNGDADVSDEVIHIYNIATDTFENLALAANSDPPFSIDGNILSLLVNESSQNNTDLNSDGDTFDNVLHIHDITPITQTGQTSGEVQILETCGLQFISGNPIGYGGVLPGDESAEQTLTMDNTGNTDLATLLVRGTDWVDGSAVTMMTVDSTKFSTTSGTYGSKTPLSTTDQTVTSSFLAGTNLDSFWQLQANLIDSAFSGTLTQTLDFTVTC